jgi:iron-sulfur cluster repair protein YtfE (RIC family)
MPIYMIGYDLHPRQGETYKELIEAIKEVGTDRWHCLESTWLVVTTKTAAEIRDELWNHMQADDRLLVVQYAPPYSAWVGLSRDCAAWLTTNM